MLTGSYEGTLVYDNPHLCSLHLYGDLRTRVGLAGVEVTRVFLQLVAQVHAGDHQKRCHEIHHAMEVAFLLKSWNQDLIGMSHPIEACQSVPNNLGHKPQEAAPRPCSRAASDASKGAKIFAVVSRIEIAP